MSNSDHNVDRVINQIMLKNGYRYLYQVADHFGVTSQTLSGWVKNGKIPPKHLLKFSEELSTAPSEQNNSILPQPIVETIDAEGSGFNFFIMVQSAVKRNLKLAIFLPFSILLPAIIYLFFMARPLYKTSATILPTNQSSASMSGLMGAASQLGLNIPMGVEDGIAWDELFPEIVKSQQLSKLLLEDNFTTKRYGENQSLLFILSNELNISTKSQGRQIEACIEYLDNMIRVNKPRFSPVVKLDVIGLEPGYTVQLARRIIHHAGQLQRNYKNSQMSTKRTFLEERITDIEDKVVEVEEKLRSFRENNRILNKSPSLQLQEERMEQELNLQRSLMITLQTQYEQAKIEEIEKAAMIQVIDEPTMPWKKVSPKIGIWLFIVFTLSILFSLFVVYTKEFLLSSA